MLKSEMEIRVRYVETDKMGFVHHGNYLAWFEAVRIHLMDELGYPYREMEADGVRLPVIDAHLRYYRPAYFDDRVRVTAIVRERPRARMRVDYQIHRGEERLTEGSTEHVFMDAEGKPCRPPERLRAIFDRYF